ncbi:hypothetical protein VFPPC_15474 [Pochonia chlamydosporia 170]|uniref:Uncharacterized protein n=1 Tax=Pochonia chlamydosporia 170 TaxID=1380566 RepID=A0A179FXD3_METCM|nr:hypothetical protein VFPPC_15474 [Pochonia chlamydosporia 170]OAQ69713.1 hypothetical protein VFPPC_15474 [Pochonia chlamydosporia 170]
MLCDITNSPPDDGDQLLECVLCTLHLGSLRDSKFACLAATWTHVSLGTKRLIDFGTRRQHKPQSNEVQE